MAPFITDAMLLVSISTMSTVALGWVFRREFLAVSARCLLRHTKQISTPSSPFTIISLSAVIRPTPLKENGFQSLNHYSLSLSLSLSQWLSEHKKNICQIHQFKIWFVFSTCKWMTSFCHFLCIKYCKHATVLIKV